MNKIYLNKTYSYDVIFNEQSFGHIILSPKGIVVTQNIQQNLINFANNEGMDILQCTIQPNNIPVTLFNLRHISEKSIVSTTFYNINSNITYSCEFAIVGHHYQNINEVNIREIHIQQNTARQWIGINYIDTNLEVPTTTISIPSTPQIIYEQNLNDFNFSINFRPTFNMNSSNDERYETSYEVDFRFNTVQNLKTSLQYINKWQILHSLFTEQINNFDTVSFSIPIENPISEQEKETAKQDMMEIFNGAEEDIISQFVNNQSEQLPELFVYMPFLNAYAEQLHFTQVPIAYRHIEQIFGDVLEKWFNLDERLSQTIIYFFEALDNNKDIIQRFLSAVKLVEGFAEKYSETYFPEDEMNDIKNFIKDKLKEYFDDNNNKVINDFTKALKYTNKSKLNLAGKIKKLISANNVDCLNLNASLIQIATDYRNTLSHSVNINRMEEIEFIVLYECYLKFLTLGFILLWKFLEIPQEVIDYGVSRLKSYQELKINNRIKRI